MNNNLKNNYVLISFFIIIALLIRAHIFSISNNSWGADPATRVIMAMQWIDKISFIPPSNVWLPLHFYLIGIGLKIFNAPMFTSRFISLIFSILSLLIFYKLICLIFEKKIAFLSLLLLIFFPIHILCSVISLPESPFLFFILASFYFYFKYKLVYTTVKMLVASAIFLILATMLRYEAWIFILFIPFLLNYESNRKWTHVMLYCSVTLIFPLLWILKSNAVHFYGNVIEAPALNYNLLERLFYWQTVLYNLFGLPAYLLALIGLWFSLKEDRTRNYAAIFSITLLFFIFGTFAYKISTNLEYSISFSTLMIPLSVYGLHRITDHFKFKRIIMIIFIATTIYILLRGIIIPASSSDVNLVADYLRYHTNKEDKILINQTHKWESTNIVLLADLTNDNVKILNNDENLESILDCINKVKPKYIVYSEDGSLPLVFNDENKKNLKYKFIEVLKTDTYKIYQVK